MLDVTAIASLTVVAGGIFTMIGYLAKQWYNIRKLMERVDKLEKQEETILSDFLTTSEHETQQAQCQREIYKDMRALEEKIEGIDKRIEKSEELRDQARAEDLLWKREMQEAVVEIRTIVKNQLYHKTTGQSLYHGV